MKTKLSLSLDTELIEKAKTYAKSKKLSLSQLIENYLKKLTIEHPDTETAVSNLEAMSGIVKLDEELDYKKSFGEHQISKYKLNSILSLCKSINITRDPKGFSLSEIPAINAEEFLKFHFKQL